MCRKGKLLNYERFLPLHVPLFKRTKCSIITFSVRVHLWHKDMLLRFLYFSPFLPFLPINRARKPPEIKMFSESSLSLFLLEPPTDFSGARLVLQQLFFLFLRSKSGGNLFFGPWQIAVFSIRRRGKTFFFRKARWTLFEGKQILLLTSELFCQFGPFSKGCAIF